MVLEILLPIAAAAVIIMAFVSYMFRTKRFTEKYVDIKEAPLEINNALKDKTKRNIIRSLQKEKKYLTLIAKEIGESVAKAKYHLKEMEKLGIITSMKLTRENFFLLTDKGIMCLNAIKVYYPKNNFERLINSAKYRRIKWRA
jgi:DNA-binding MarR family transcriptional regulator